VLLEIPVLAFETVQEIHPIAQGSRRLLEYGRMRLKEACENSSVGRKKSKDSEHLNDNDQKAPQIEEPSNSHERQLVQERGYMGL